jgi:hypothetical protein
MRERPDLKAVSDDTLLRGLFEVLRQTRHDETDLVAHIAEVDARKLYAREASHSMFAYCTEVLHLSEPEAGLRIRVARVSRRHPVVLTMLREGRIHLSGIALLAPVLTRRNRDSLLRRATHKSKRQIQELVAELSPRPDVAATMRRLPVRRGTASELAGSLRPDQVASVSADAATCSDPQQRPDTVVTVTPDAATASSCEQCPDVIVPVNGWQAKLSRPAQPVDGARADARAASLLLSPPPPEPRPARPATLEPLAPGRYSVRFTASAELRDKLERLQALMRHKVPDGDLAKVIDVAVTRELERREAKRFGKTKAPRKRLAQTDTRPKSRYIPAAVRRFVERRDGGRCTYRDRHGRRCTKRHDLEFHHWEAYGRGGPHSPERISLMCKVHNALLAEEDYGKEKMARYRRRGRRGARPPAGIAVGPLPGDTLGTTSGEVTLRPG